VKKITINCVPVHHSDCYSDCSKVPLTLERIPRGARLIPSCGYLCGSEGYWRGRFKDILNLNEVSLLAVRHFLEGC